MLYARVAQELVAATGVVHGAGLGHRDINIYNIMFNSSGSLVLIDLGSTMPLELPVTDRQQISVVQEAMQEAAVQTQINGDLQSSGVGRPVQNFRAESRRES